jgi:hypothetical protein
VLAFDSSLAVADLGNIALSLVVEDSLFDTAVASRTPVTRWSATSP